MRTPPPPEKSLCIPYHAPSSRFSTLESAGFLWLWGRLGQLASVHSTKWQRPLPQPFMQWLDIMNTTRLIRFFYQWFLNVLFFNCFSWKCLVFFLLHLSVKPSDAQHCTASPSATGPTLTTALPSSPTGTASKKSDEWCNLVCLPNPGLQQAADCVWLMLAQPVLKKIDILSVQNLCVCYLRPRVASC